MLLSTSTKIKKITFPEEEIETLITQNKIITTRVSKDYNTFFVNDLVKTPWQDIFKVVKRQEITDIKKHPFYNELTEEQIKFLSRYNKIAILTLIKIITNASYDPPYSESQMREHGYSESIIQRLKNDPVHKWRMDTGIELIHIEPTRTELNRIWKNWQQMTSELKNISDRKCHELFGYNNDVLYRYLIPQYKVEAPEKGVVKYPPKS